VPTRFFKEMKTKGEVIFQVGYMYVNEMPLKESELFVKISASKASIESCSLRA